MQPRPYRNQRPDASPPRRPRLPSQPGDLRRHQLLDESDMSLVWRWRTCADPNRPPGHRIAHPLAHRFGQTCRLLAQGRNGNRLVEFEDGFRVVAPLYATRSARG